VSITNCSKNCLGTVSFDGKFTGMRKEQDFIVYPMQDAGEEIKIQSATRMGTLHLGTGELKMSQAHPNGAYFLHLQLDRLIVETLPMEDVQMLRGWVKSTGGTLVGGDNALRIFCDNTGAIAL
jgi:hypothetical protein